MKHITSTYYDLYDLYDLYDMYLYVYDLMMYDDVWCMMSRNVFRLDSLDLRLHSIKSLSVARVCNQAHSDPSSTWPGAHCSVMQHVQPFKWTGNTWKHKPHDNSPRTLQQYDLTSPKGKKVGEVFIGSALRFDALLQSFTQSSSAMMLLWCFMIFYDSIFRSLLQKISAVSTPNVTAVPSQYPTGHSNFDSQP